MKYYFNEKFLSDFYELIKINIYYMKLFNETKLIFSDIRDAIENNEKYHIIWSIDDIHVI